MGISSDDRVLAENSDKDIGVEAADMFPMRVLQALLRQRGTQFEDGIGCADFLNGQDVGADEKDAFLDLRFCLRGFGRAVAGRCEGVALEIVRREPERLGRKGESGEEAEAGSKKKNQALSGLDPGKEAHGRLKVCSQA